MRSILGIDTASPRGSLALLVDGAPRGMAALPPGGHSSGLAALAARLVAEARFPLASLTGIAVNEGPGSFTGLRIGLAWAKGLAVGCDRPLVLVSAHEAAAHDAIAAPGAMPTARGDDDRAKRFFVTVTPGERKQVELTLWDGLAGAQGAQGRPRRFQGPESVPEEDLAERIESLATGRPFEALPANDAIAALLDDDEIPRRAVAPLALSVAILGDLMLASGHASDVVLAAPAYGRAPNARKPSP